MDEYTKWFNGLTKPLNKANLSCWISSKSHRLSPSAWWKSPPKYIFYLDIKYRIYFTTKRYRTTSGKDDSLNNNTKLFCHCSTNRFTPRRITGSAKSTWWCATDATIIACAASAIRTAVGIKNPILVNPTLLGKLHKGSSCSTNGLEIRVSRWPRKLGPFHTYIL